MKKIYFITLFLSFHVLFSQNFNWNAALSQIYTPTSSDSPRKILLDKAPMFADLYNFNDPEFNTSNYDHFQQSISELNIASNNIFTNSAPLTLLLPSPNPSVVQEIPIGIVNTKCAYLNYDEEDNYNGNLKLVNNVFIPIFSSVPNFIEKDLLVISPLVASFTSPTNSFKFRIDSNQFFQYINKIQKLEADFGDGVWKTLINNFVIQSSVTVTINTSGIQKQKITFKASLDNGNQITTYSELLLAKTFIPTPQIGLKTGACGISQLIKHRSTIADATGVKGEIEYKIWYGNNNNSCNVRKPIIIVDGFDPGDKRRIDLNDCLVDKRCRDEYIFDPSILTQQNYPSLSKLMNYSGGSLIDKLNENNFDVIMVNLPYYSKIPNDSNSELICAGADDIIRNAYSLASFIQKLNTDLQTIGSTEKLVVVGPSMGGLITRYALAYLEKQGINHNTKVWVSMDSPHQGANIPLAVQKDIWFFAKKLKQNGANKQFTGLLHSPAAEQMLIDIVKDDFWGNISEKQNTTFISTLRNNGVSGSSGYPVSYGIKNIAITNGSMAGTKNVNPQENFLHIKASAKIRLLGIRVGRKRIFRVNNYFMPNYGGNSMLVDLQGRNPDENVGDTNYSTTINSAWNNNGSMDAVPGGSTNSANEVKAEINASLDGTNAFSFPLSFGNWFVIPLLTTDKNLIIDRIIPTNKETIINPQAFIPMHSALDTSGFSDWYQSINKNITCSGQTKFDSFYGETYNMDHVSFTPNMVNWLIKSITEGIQPPSFPIEPSQFTGANLICPNTTNTYSFADICKIPGNVIWSLSNNNAQIMSSTSTSVTLKGIANGNTILTADFGNGQTLTKNITVFMLSTLPTPSGTFQINAEINCYDDGAKPITFIPDTSFPGIISISPSMLPHPLRSQSRDITVKYTNPCTGEYVSTVITFDYQAPDCPFNKNSNNNLFTIYPNPTNDIINISLVDENNKPTSISDASVELYNSLGVKQSQTTLNNNKATITTNNLLQGIYTMKIYYDQKVETHQIIKN